jgi:hypothetical protein
LIQTIDLVIRGVVICRGEDTPLMPALHDPIPYDSVAKLIGTAEPSRRSTVLHDAWRDYAAKAARPYAWKTFALYARRQLMQSGDWSLKRGKAKLTPWQDGARASPRVLMLGAYAAVRVRGGALESSTDRTISG